MLPSVRRDLEDLESRLETLLQKQGQLEEKLSALAPDLKRSMQAETDHLVKQSAENFEAQTKWMATNFAQLRAENLERGQFDKAEIINAIAALSAAHKKGMDELRAQIAQVAESVETQGAQGAQLAAQFETFELDWRDSIEMPIDDTSAEAVRAWSERVGAEVKKFGAAQGMPRSFAYQLLEELKELRAFDEELERESGDFDERLDELQRVLFSAERFMPWTCLTPHNSTPAQRSKLRVLETAVAQLRSYLQERLLQVTGIRPLEIVPFATQFDATIHESNEFLEVPTTDDKRHNKILSVDKSGFQKLSPYGEARLLRPARVRRYVTQKPSPVVVEPTPEEVEIAEEPAAVEIELNEVAENEREQGSSADSIPRVSGQL